jgi:hypothetical protein
MTRAGLKVALAVLSLAATAGGWAALAGSDTQPWTLTEPLPTIADPPPTVTRPLPTVTRPLPTVTRPLPTLAQPPAKSVVGELTTTARVIRPIARTRSSR